MIHPFGTRNWTRCDGSGRDTWGESTNKRLAGWASMIRRSDSASLPTVNTPLTAFGWAVNAIIPCVSRRCTSLQYSEREPTTRAGLSGSVWFSAHTSASERRSDGDAGGMELTAGGACAYRAAMSGGNTLIRGTMLSDEGSATRWAMRGTTAVAAEEKAELSGRECSARIAWSCSGPSMRSGRTLNLCGTAAAAEVWWSEALPRAAWFDVWCGSGGPLIRCALVRSRSNW